MKHTVFQKVWDYTKTIPSGHVTTYGDIAQKLSLSPRTVGWALHANTKNDVPCHRVVNKKGFLAKNFAFNGEKEQRRRLENEGVVFVSSNQVDMTKSYYKHK